MVEVKQTNSSKAPQYNKLAKQETFTSSRGNKYLMTFPGTQQAQVKIDDASMMSNGIQSTALLAENIMNEMLEGTEYTWKYFDALVDDGDKTGSVEVQDHDGKKVKYNFQLPDLKRVYQIYDSRYDGFGRPKDSAMFTEIMKDVITNKDVNWKYWDHHDGFMKVETASIEWLINAITNTELDEVIAAARDFESRMFR